MGPSCVFSIFTLYKFCISTPSISSFVLCPSFLKTTLFIAFPLPSRPVRGGFLFLRFLCLFVSASRKSRRANAVGDQHLYRGFRDAFELSVMKSGDMLCVLGGSSSWLMFSMNFYSVASLPMVASSVFFQNLICYTGWEGR